MSPPRHRLDDPVTGRGLLFAVTAVQLWTSGFMWVLTDWAYGNGLLALVNIALIDLIAFLAARIGANENYPRGVRRLAWTISGSCFLIMALGNVLSHVVVTGAGVAAGWDQWKPWIRVVLGTLPVPLLLMLVGLQVQIRGFIDRVIAGERDQERQAAAAAAERDRTAAEAAERRAHELQLAQARKPAEVPVVAVPVKPARKAIEPATSGRDEARYAALKGETKREKARAWILEEWAAGRTPTGSEVDEVVGGSSTGRKAITELIAEGYTPGVNPYPLHAVRNG